MSQILIEKFYTAFREKDWKTMQSCYDDQATFYDPVFQQLTSKQVKAMWHMLSLANQEVKIVFGDVKSDGLKGSCHWEADYVFSRTGRNVHNVIEASFSFSGGKIKQHNDSFDLWKWAGMALGVSGKLLGWTGLIRKKIRNTAQKSLFRFIKEHPEYQ